MGKVGEVTLLGIMGVFTAVGALQALGSQVAGGDHTHSEVASAATAPAAVAERPSSAARTVAAEPAPRVGETLYEQAIFDAFPQTPPKSRVAKKKAAEAADLISATINLNGHLCARPVEMQKAADGLYGISCISRRDGSGRSNYLLNIRSGAVSEI